MSDIRKFSVEVLQIVEVELDASKFDEAFMEEFRQHFYPFDTITDHAEHIAQLQARGLIDVSYESKEFIEGYGPHDEMGIRARVTDTEIDFLREVAA